MISSSRPALDLNLADLRLMQANHLTIDPQDVEAFVARHERRQMQLLDEQADMRQQIYSLVEQQHRWYCRWKWTLAVLLALSAAWLWTVVAPAFWRYLR